MTKKLTVNKAKEILTDGSVHGKPLTLKQKRFFGAIAGGAPIKAKSGGWLDSYQEGGVESRQAGYTDIPFNYNSAWGGQFAIGGELSKENVLCPPGYFYDADLKQCVPSRNNSLYTSNISGSGMRREGPYFENVDMNLPQGTGAPKGFFTGFGFSQNVAPSVDVHGVGAYGEREILDGVRLTGSAVSPSVVYPGGSQLFMKPSFNVGAKMKFNAGGSLPGSVGFTYARTNSPAPSEGPYAKKTMPSAEYGMSYYQHGLDWKPRNISENGSEIPRAQTGLDWMGGDPAVQLRNRILQERLQKPRVSKQASVGPARKESFFDKQRIQNLKQQYVNTHPYSELDENNNIVPKYTDRTIEGRALPYTRAAALDKGMGVAMDAVNVASVVTGLGSIASNALRLGAGALERQIGRNIVSRNLKNVTSKVNPYINQADDALAYAQMDPIGIMGNRINSRHYNPQVALNVSNNTLTGVDRNLKNTAIESADLTLGENNLANVIGSVESQGGKLVDLYRVQQKEAKTFAQLAAEGKIPKVFNNPEVLARKAAEEKHFGQWFTNDKADIDWYMKDREFTNPEIIQLRVPKSKLSQYQNYDKTLSRAPEREFVIPLDQQKLFIPKQLPGSSNAFKSEIDWAKWNPETPNYPELINEYNAIEESSKKAGTWMTQPRDYSVFSDVDEMNLKGLKDKLQKGELSPSQIEVANRMIPILENQKAQSTVFQGTPEQFIQQQSSHFKKAFPQGAEKTYRGTYGDMNTENLFKSYPEGRGIFTGDIKTAEHYAGDKGKVFELFHPKTSNSYNIDVEGKSWREVPIESLPGMESNKTFLGKRVADTDDIATWAEKNNVDYVTMKNIFDGIDAKYSRIVNNRPGNFLKSATGNVGFFDMTNPNIYKALIPTVVGAAALQKQKKGGVIKDDRGQWAHPGEITEIGSNRITMQGVPYPVLGISDTGDTQMMLPGEEYKFKGSKVREFPITKKVNQKSTGGWLDGYK